MRSYAAVTFVGAFLLFLVQPLMARAILPWFGGAAAVWTTSLLFYQTLLLGGYLYAHLGSRLGRRRQALLHGALLLVTLALLPITPSPTPGVAADPAPAWHLLRLLTASVGGPYLLLAATAPLLHDWFAREAPGRSPYPLYAVSNVGSLLALLAYPTLVEPLVGVSHQGWAWSAAYGSFVLACAVVVWRVVRHAGAEGTVAGPPRADGTPAPADVTLWLLLAACGSGLLLAITNHITLDVAPAPLLWILPLALYLLSFVLAFAGAYRRRIWGSFLVLALGAMALLWNWGFAFPASVQVAGSAGSLFVACMVLHGELAAGAPHARHLTRFYLTMAAGGALGGMLVALVAPAVLHDFWELPVLLLAAWGLQLAVLWRDPCSALHRGARPVRWAALLSVGALAAAAFWVPTLRRTRGTVATERNFYGVLRVQDRPRGVLHDMRVLLDGRILHGGQFLDPARRDRPTAYFTAGSGVALALALHPRRRAGHPLRIGVIGLGVGTIAAWTRPGDTVRFYELNPAVESFARRYFTFLHDAPAVVEVVPGDGRLSLARETRPPRAGPRYDVLVVDAFSSDAIPVHLLTREAAWLYRRALAGGGVLVFQATNRHVDLAPVIRGLAGASGLEALEITTDPPEGSGGISSTWFVLADDPAFLADVRARAKARRPAGRGGAVERPTPADTILWTDDFSDLLRVLRWTRVRTRGNVRSGVRSGMETSGGRGT